jgi:hypothetical protein
MINQNLGWGNTSEWKRCSQLLKRVERNMERLPIESDDKIKLLPSIG